MLTSKREKGNLERGAWERDATQPASIQKGKTVSISVLEEPVYIQNIINIGNRETVEP